MPAQRIKLYYNAYMYMQTFAPTPVGQGGSGRHPGLDMPVLA